ncbi:hypothetical protein M405DRAFT_526543 [Rhizopogon salebrosus TDB-379]|nr:hypothetical protein M405DRAFT_526543 [Rhizopogon salebrosus TDB-379]
MLPEIYEVQGRIDGTMIDKRKGMPVFFNGHTLWCRGRRICAGQRDVCECIFDGTLCVWLRETRETVLAIELPQPHGNFLRCHTYSMGANQRQAIRANWSFGICNAATAELADCIHSESGWYPSRH